MDPVASMDYLEKRKFIFSCRKEEISLATELNHGPFFAKSLFSFSFVRKNLFVCDTPVWPELPCKTFPISALNSQLAVCREGCTQLADFIM